MTGRMKTIYEMFEEQVRRAPEEVAIVFGEERVTYGELNKRANQLARHLGIEVGEMVALCMDRSVEMVVGLLAVLKAGGVYVRLSPLFPDERLEFMLEDTGAKVLLKHWELGERFRNFKGRVIEVAECFKGEDENLGKMTGVDDLACVIYTSGSTGKPKGVLIERGGMINVFTSVSEILGMRPRDKLLAITTVAFDIAGFELFAPLVTGGQVVLVPREVSRDILELARYMGEIEPTVMSATPATWRGLLESGWEGDRHLTALSSGEKLGDGLAQKLLKKCKGLWNLYGPTETTIWSTVYKVEKGKKVTIGHPLPRTKIYIVDQNLHVVPPGEEGEILIAGIGVARGYLNRPELTAKSFIENPFTKDKRYARVYRTGDLGRLLPDGNIEYLGRRDEQVKIRGFRVELGEIEYALRRNPKIKNSVVIARDGRLIAYLTLKKPQEEVGTIIAALREELGAILPDYMIPNAFVFLEHFPLTPSRKIDKKALPDPEMHYHAEPYHAPKNALEEKLAGMWSEILKVKSVSSTDNFFYLGGHSLLAIKLLARIRDTFQIDLPLRVIFDHPTVKGLSTVLLEKEKEENKPLMPLVPQNRDRLIPLSFAQQRLWFLDQIVPEKSIYNIPFLVRLKEPVNRHAVERSFEAMIQRHETLRTCFKVHNGTPYQQIEDRVKFSIGAKENIRGVFDLSVAPLFRASLKDDLLVIVFHHVIADEWSLEVFAEEFQAFYDHFAHQKILELPELPVQYADYAIWQRAWLEGEVLEKQLAYWKKELGDAPEGINFPFDHPRPAVASYKGKIHHTEIPRKTFDAVKTLAEKKGCTVFMVLLAALHTLFYRYTLQDDIVIGSPIAHRNMKEVERIIGFFVNTIALRSRLMGKNPRFIDFLKEMKETVLQAFAHQDVPFEQLVEHLNVTRDLGRHPIFQVVLALEGMEPFKVEVQDAKFDLTFTLREESLSIEYATDLFVASTIERLAKHYIQILDAIGKNPEIRIEEIELFTPFPVVETKRSEDQTVHALIKTSDKVALVCEKEQITYRELNKKGNQLAHLLLADKLIAICLDRGIDFVVSMLGILKAGSAYVPLDPTYPDERLKFMLEDSGAAVLITHSRYRDKFPNYTGHVIEIDQVKLSKEAKPVKEAKLAYVIYTSGTTGRPKGVLIEHAALCDRIDGCQRLCPLSESDRFLHMFSFSFDGAVLACWWPLAMGATLVIPTQMLEDGLMEKYQINTVFSTPSILQFLFQDFSGNLKTVIAGGEKLSKELAVKIQKHAGALYNFYGPTEATILATGGKVKGGKEPSIGKPILNTTVHILTPSLNAMPVGAIGEIYIGGKDLARGYLNRPDLTQGKFILLHGERVYATGDLGKFAPDGEIYYAGRKDEQVKIRGYRIELGEIETVLLEQPEVQECVVFSQQGRLIGYLVLKEGAHLKKIVDKLHLFLPEYMIPTSLLVVKELPRTPGGKLERPVEISTPLTETEKLLAEICGRLLDIEHVNLNQTFFQIGGHSLLATQLMAMIRKTFQVEVPLRTLFEHPVLRDLARQIDERMEERREIGAQLPALSVDEEHRYEPFPLTDVQQAYLIGRSGLFELSHVSAHSYSEYDYPDLDIPRLEKAWNLLIQRHEALRLIFPNESQQQILKSVPYFSFPLEQDPEKVRKELSSQILPADTWPLFDIRFSKKRMHISLDGLNMDAWSVSILFAEWRKLYKNLKAELPPLHLSFRDYVVYLKSLEDTDLYKRDRKYWIDRIPNFPPAPPLRTRKNPDQAVQKFSRQTKTFKGWKKLQEQIRELKISPAAFLTATLAEVLARWSSSSHFALNLTLFQRLPVHPQINAIMGDFTSLLVLEIDHRGAETFLDRAKRVQKQLWKDLDHGLFGGVAFIRALAHAQKKEGSVLMPIVFTCVLHESQETVTDKGQLVYSITQTPQVWLDCKALEEKGDLIIEWDYLGDLFPPGMIEEMHTAYFNLLETKSFELPPKYQTAIWKVEYHLLHELFYAKATEHPNAPAVFSARGNLTYQELEKIVNQLGHKLRELGAKPNHLVAILMGKGWEQVAACLGILASGAAYVPLDVELPLARLEFLLVQTEVQIILTTTKYLDLIFQLTQDYQVICVDERENESVARLKPVQKLDDLAYVIFTSGSTGLPKGVMIDHKAVVNTILDINDRYKVSENDRVFALSSLHFDLSVYDIFGPLAAGGAIVMPPHESRRDPKVWLEWMAKEKVTLWNSVPMLMQMLLEQEEIPPIPLRLVLLSGDVIPLTLPARIQEAFPKAEIVSLGGATEAAIWSIYYPVNKVDPEWKTIPYGKPLRNQQFYVLNDKLEDCPDWVPGHLYIGGVGLAKGYWKDEAQTQKRFQNGLFNTGDLGAYYPDGNIEFLGREDFQVKIKGYRIELGEIEFQLLQIPMVQQAVVDVYKDVQGQKYLVAYVVFKKLELVQDTGPLAIEEAEKLTFKLEQHGIEKFHRPPDIVLEKHPFDEDHYYVRKSYRTYQDKMISRHEFEKWLAHSFAPLSLKEIQLDDFRALTYEDGRLPKYLYPSAGGLYPVQIYVRHDATYYYHPIKHALYKVSDESTRERELLFIPKKAAIEPAYGILSDNFCQLEIGYMKGLLQHERLPAPDILIYVKTGRIEGLEGGWYTYPLKQISAETPLDDVPGVGEMSSTFHEAAFYIFFTGDPVQAGFYSQRLMEEGIQHKIGLCPIGNLDTYTASFVKADVIHTLVGGRVSREQIGSREVSDPKGAPFFQDYLQKKLEKILPEYMVPTYFFFLDHLPLTSNGKVDRRSLPTPAAEPEKPLEETAHNYMEMVLQSLWEECLKRPVGATDNFFEVGGNSLLMVRLVNLINKKGTLTVADFIKNPTIAGLASLMTSKVLETPSHLLTIQNQGTKTPLFLIHPAGGLALPYLPLARYFPDQPIYGISNPRFATTEDPFSSVEEMAKDYIEKIKTIQPEGPYLIGGWSFGGTVALEMAHQLVSEAQIFLIDTFYEAGGEITPEILDNVLAPYGLEVDSEEGRAIAAEMRQTQKLLSAYEPHIYEGKASLLKAKEGSTDPFNGLKPWVPHLKSYLIDGAHDFLFSDPFIAGVADGLRQALES